MEQVSAHGPARGQSLVDVLDRILDKGLVVAGDIRIQLADVELLTIQIRLLVCSVDKAEEIGLNWWKNDSFLTSGDKPELSDLTEKLTRMEQRLERMEREQLGEGEQSAE